MAETYRPANSDEADGFMARFCERCMHYDLCTIYDDAAMFDEDDPEYPTEWVCDADGDPVSTARCTAFDPLEARHG